MSYKLYDFTKEVVPEELDEQIRLLCDVLYNQREIYEKQLSAAAKDSFLGLSVPDAFSNLHTLFFEAHFAGAFPHNCTLATAGLQHGAARHKDNFVSCFGAVETSTALDNIAHVETSGPTNTDTLPSQIQMKYSPSLQWFVKTFDTAADISDCEYWCSLANHINPPNPKATTTTKFFAFSYDTVAGDTTWQLRTRKSSGGAIEILANTGVTVETNAYYVFDLQFPFEVISGTYGFYLLWRVRKWKNTGAGATDFITFQDTGFQYITEDSTGIELPALFVESDFPLDTPMSIGIACKNKLVGTARRLFYKYASAVMKAPIVKMNPSTQFE